MATKAKRTKVSVLFTTVLYLLLETTKCDSNLSTYNPGMHLQLNLNYEQIFSKLDHIKPDCELVYQDYVQALMDFTHCELSYVRPFRLCLSCDKKFQLTKELYTNLTTNPDHEECKTKYMMSDKVQIIPTVQTDIEKMWRTAHCHKCYSGKEILHEKVKEFLSLYANFTSCINSTSSEHHNTSDKCIKCRHAYSSLNSNFNSMYDAYVGDVCMDLVDMMNYTRIKWSSQYNCTHNSVDPTPVIIISCIVACTPVLFYVYLRLTGKVRGAKLFKPKRLAGGTDTSSATHAVSSSHQTH